MKLKHTAIAAALLAVAPFAMAEQGKASGMSTDTRASGMHSDATMSDSATVRHVQEQLSQRGFDPGPIDGVMGPQTRAALRNFQQSQGITDSRGLDDKTMSALGVEKSAGTTPHSSKTVGEGTMGTAPEQQTSGTGTRGAAPDRPGMTTTPPQGGTSRGDTTSAGEGTMGTAPAQQPNASRSGTTVERPDRSATTTTTPGGTTRSESTTAGEGTMGTAPSQQNDAARGTTGTPTKRY